MKIIKLFTLYIWLLIALVNFISSNFIYPGMLVLRIKYSDGITIFEVHHWWSLILTLLMYILAVVNIILFHKDLWALLKSCWQR